MSLAARRLARLAVASAAVSLAGVMVTAGPLAATAHAAAVTPTLSAFDARLLHDINQARVAHGRRPLILVAGTTDVAHGWSCHMAASAVLEHNPNLGYALEHHGSWNWTTYGENAGVLPSADGGDVLFLAYMNSPEHRANILNPGYRYVGVWSKQNHATRWNTIDFVGQWAGSYAYSYGPARRRC